jgi:O-antigen ligase
MWQKSKVDPVRALLVLFAATLPFDHTPSVQFHGLSVRPNVIIGGILVLFLFIRVIRQKKIPRVAWQWWVLLLWLIWVCSGLFWAQDGHAAIKVVVPLGTLGVIGLATAVLWKKDYIEPVIKAILGGGIAATIFGFYQFIGNYAGLPNSVTAIREEYSWQRFGFPRMQSTMLEPLYFSAYLLLPIGLLTVLILTSKNYRRWYWFGALGLFVLADILTLSRGGLAALVILFIVLFVQYWRAGFVGKHLRTIGIVATATVVIFIAALGVISLTARQGNDSDLTNNQKGAGTFLSQLRNFHFTANSRNKQLDDSVAQRATARSEALDVLSSDHRVLLVGIGPGQYANYESRRHIVGYSTPNNVILDQLIQSGGIGLALLITWVVGIIWALLKRTWGSRRRVSRPQLLGKVAIAYLLALGFQAQTFTGLALTHLWFVVGLTLFLIQLPQDQTKHKQHDPSPQKKSTH